MSDETLNTFEIIMEIILIAGVLLIIGQVCV